MKYKKGDMVLVDMYGSKTTCFIESIDMSKEFPYELFCFPNFFSSCKEEDIVKKVKDNSEFWFNNI